MRSLTFVSSLGLLLSLMKLPTALAAACCAGNAAAPALISGDESSQLGITAARISVIGDAPGSGIPVFRSAHESETTASARLDFATLINDRWQVGAVVPWIQHRVSRLGSDSSASSLGDLKLNVGFEALPEWTYSAWKPRGYVFAQAILPTSRSIYETESSTATDTIGRGFLGLAVGALLLKHGAEWDAFLIPELHHSFSRSFNTSATSYEVLEVSPGWGASIAFGGGWSWSEFRLGARLQPVYAQGKRVRSPSSDTISTYQLSWDAGLDVTYLANEDWSFTAAYTDQTLIGPAVNSSLSRSFALGLQRRWQR